MNEKHVVAVAGGGKTTYLVSEIKNALKSSPETRVMAITYTRNMAKELKQKVGRQLTYCGTLHHVLYALLREKYPDKYLVVVDENEDRDIIEDIGLRIGHKVSQNKLQELTRKKEYELTYRDKLFLKHYKNYYSANRMISFLLIEIYGETLIGGLAWDYIFVDEYQDMSEGNMRIINNMKAKSKLFVYDPMQSIYGFRGARPDLLPQSNDILGRSYRCPEAICHLANHLITYSDNPYPVMMQPVKEGGELKIIRDVPAADHYSGLDDEVKRLLEKYSPGEIAIIARTNRMLEEAQEKLSGLPYQRVSSQVLRSKEMQALNYLLRLMQMQDNYNVVRFAKAARLIDKKGAALSSYIDPITGKVTGEGKNAADSIREMPLYKNILMSMDVNPVPVAVRFVLESMNGYAAMIDECVDIIEWLSIYYGKDWEKLHSALTEIDVDALLGREDKIRLMTVHTAKGLEYKAVILLNVYNGVFPHHNADKEEELRLFYVAITRASEELVIYKCGKHTWLDNYSQPI